jgi:cobalt-zinc-cadmium efflux system outer membrane protein
MRAAVPSLVAILALAGCGGTRDDGFKEVQGIVGERTQARIHWYQGSAEDDSATAAVRELLTRPLTVDTAIQIALLNNRSLQATYEDLGVAQADLVRAGLLRNPVFDADAKFVRGGGGVRIEMSLVADFLDLFFIPMRKRLAETAFEGARLRVSGAVIDLAAQVRGAVYRHQTSTQLLEMRRTVVEAASAAYDLSQRLRAAGNIPKLDLAEQRGLYEQSKLDLAHAELQVAETRERVTTLLGLWGNDTGWTVSERLAEPSAEDPLAEGLERRAIEGSLDLAILRTQISRDAQRLGVARPFGALEHADLGVAAEREIDGEKAAGPAISVPLPLFNMGQASVNAARAELRRSQDLYAAEAIEIRSRVRTAGTRVGAARARVDFLKQVMLPLRQSMVAETQLQYNGMLASPFRLIQAKQQEIAAGANYVDALGRYWQARAVLDQILDGRLPVMETVDTMPASAGMSGQAEGGH